MVRTHLLPRVQHHGARQADQRVHGEQEALLLVRLGPEHQQPQVQRGLGQGLREIVARAVRGGGHLAPQDELGEGERGHHRQRGGEHDVEVEAAVEQVEGGGLGAVQVGAMRGEDVVEHDVEAGRHGLAVVVGVHQHLGAEDGDGRDEAPLHEQRHLLLKQQNIHGDGQTYERCKWPAWNIK